ncbi:response regulator [Paenibacillus sp. NPDC058177]|uniref:response regulator n=1 Tax=Paenibacillus sp. NPDC058177 TaxID=3346369 RepID=UPI0036D84B89
MINVIIVEDDPMVAKFNRHYLEQMDGFRYTGCAASVEEANVLLASQQVDLILLDIYMPKSNGLQLLSFLREQGSTVDVIVISAASDNVSIRNALQHGAVDYLIKPFEFARFQAALTTYRENNLLMRHRKNLNQEQLDKLVRHRGETEKNSVVVSAAPVLPKGLSESTLDNIWEIINGLSQDSFSTDDISTRAPISRISVRKYLMYLTETGALSMEISYGAIGRPVYKYRVISEGHTGESPNI